MLTCSKPTPEATALVTPQMILWIVIAGLVPSVVLAMTRIQTGKWWYALLMRVAAMLGALLVIILVAAVFYKRLCVAVSQQ